MHRLHIHSFDWYYDYQTTPVTMLCREEQEYIRKRNLERLISTRAEAKLLENPVVMTKIEDEAGVRNEQKLKFSSNLWWIPDGSMYVYYTPTHFAEL